MIVRGRIHKVAEIAAERVLPRELVRAINLGDEVELSANLPRDIPKRKRRNGEK